MEGVYDLIPGFITDIIGNEDINDPTVQEKRKIRSDFKLEFEDIVEENGFKFSDKEIMTSDGYYLNCFRIRKRGLASNAPAIFFNHGMIDSADSWIMNGRENSPAFIAADAGYDVFLGNNRGSRFSKKHMTTWDAESVEVDQRRHYWDFSFQEMAEYDAKAFLDYITEETGNKKVTWVGESSGNTQMFYALADPELQPYFKEKLNLMVALAPLTRMDHMSSLLIKFWSNLSGIIGFTMNTLGIYEVFGEGTHGFSREICSVLPELCHLALSFVETTTSEYDNIDRLQVYEGHMLASTSTRSISHFSQIYYTSKF